MVLAVAHPAPQLPGPILLPRCSPREPLMSRLILKDMALKTLKPAKRETYFDASTPGFAVRITPAGTKTFVIVHGPERARKWEKIGTYPLQSLSRAREEARNRLSAIQLGIKPAAPVMPSVRRTR